jgi:hypothetical protein
MTLGKNFMKIILLLLCVVLATSGCINVAKINTGFRRIDQLWALEYQRTEDEYRYRILDCTPDVAYSCIKDAFLTLGMPIKSASLTSGYIECEAEAPLPLTRDEWRLVAKEESPKMKEAAGWMFTLPDNPRGYFVTVRAAFKPISGKTLVLLQYRLDHPEYRKIGFEPSVHAPPTAVQLGSLKFWAAVEHAMEVKSMDAPRKRTTEEKKVLRM